MEGRSGVEKRMMEIGEKLKEWSGVEGKKEKRKAESERKKGSKREKEG